MSFIRIQTYPWEAKANQDSAGAQGLACGNADRVVAVAGSKQDRYVVLHAIPVSKTHSYTHSYTR